MDTNNFHRAVLLQEVLNALHVQKGRLYIDATLGGGSHTFEIIKRGGIVLGVDQDKDAIDFVLQKYNSLEKQHSVKDQLIIQHGNFRDLMLIAHKSGFDKVDGILFDLGVSSYQLDTRERGFSFNDGPLDMRMDTTLSVSAKDLLHALTISELTMLFQKFGEEYKAKQIATEIAERRKHKQITTTSELAEIVQHVYRLKKFKINPATKVFQALRIAVNDELTSIQEALPQALELLSGKGRIATITFHSLEDRIIKHAFKEFESSNRGKIITKKPITPTVEEVQINRRARSAKLRVIEKN